MNNILASYKQYRESGGGLEVNRKDFCKIVNEFNKHIMNLVFEGDEVKLPEKMGTLSVRGKKVIPRYNEELGRIDNEAVDYGETNKLWAKCPECKEKKQVVYHLNEHTDNIRYKFFWSKDRMIVENKLFYTMIFTRTNKRHLSQLIQNGGDYYVEPKKY
jgi:DNA polymerase elongation subunit (family B)